MNKRFLIILFVVLVILDWISKYFMIDLLGQQGNYIAVIGNFFKLFLLYNTGFSFSLGADYPTVMRFIWGPGAIIVSLLFLYAALKTTAANSLTAKAHTNPTDHTVTVTPASHFDMVVNTIAFTLLAAGGFANAVERLFYGWVTDFLSFTFFGKYSFAVFNVADIYVSLGAAGLVFLIVKGFLVKGTPASK